jgi:hypothetical protein
MNQILLVKKMDKKRPRSCFGQSLQIVVKVHFDPLSRTMSNIQKYKKLKQPGNLCQKT